MAIDHHGTTFGVNLYKLRRIGTMDLPPFAARMVLATNHLVGCEGVTIGGGGAQRVMAAWQELAGSLRTAMTTSVQHVYDGCDAVIAIADTYAGTDSAAAHEFHRRTADETAKHLSQVYATPNSRPQIVDPDPASI